jgi:hypothetical protein
MSGTPINSVECNCVIIHKLKCECTQCRIIGIEIVESKVRVLASMPFVKVIDLFLSFSPFVRKEVAL